MSIKVFNGNVPSNVSKDAKYGIKRKNGKDVVALTYEHKDGETWFPSTDVHDELVKMVNKVKIEKSGSPNGSFYINEFKQVIVPVSGKEEKYYAGKYEKPLEFEFEGSKLVGEAVNLKGEKINPGDDWEGPHPGISYILVAGGKDIRYEYSPRPNVIVKKKLSKEIGVKEAAEVAGNIATIKGMEGGRFYVNEFGTIFAPVAENDNYKYKYIGKLNMDMWFPEPVMD